MKLTFPEDWREQPCFIVAIPGPLVSFVGGLLKLGEQKGLWLTSDDYGRAYTAIIELERCLVATCVNDLIESNAALYRLLNTALFGVTYEQTGTDPLVVIPAIEPLVTLEVFNQDSVMGRIDRLTQLLDNRLAGTETPLYEYTNGIKQQLQAILDAIGSDDADIAAIRVAAEAIAVLVGI